MKIHVMKISALVLTIMVMSALSGCATQRHSKANKAISAIEISSSKNIKILWADWYQINDKAVIHGSLKRKSHGAAPMKAHLGVQVLSEKGDILQTVHSKDIYVPRNLSGKGIKTKRFEIELKNVPDASTVLVSASQGNDV